MSMWIVKARKILSQSLIYLGLVVLSLVILMPLGWTLTAALKPDNVTIFDVPTQWLPTKYFEWGNFQRAMTMETRPFGLYMRNTLTIVGFNVIGNLVCCTMAAYAFARLRFRGKEFLFNFLLVTMLVPWQVLMIPQFIMFTKLGMYGSPLPLILPSFIGNVGSAFYIFLIRQYMTSINRELEEAAQIDGCNYLQRFLYVILPLSLPVLVVMSVYVFLSVWNDLMGPLIYLTNNYQFTVSLGLANFVVSRSRTPWNLMMAANLITMLPAVILYFFAQKRLVGGIAAIGIKG